MAKAPGTRRVAAQSAWASEAEIKASPELEAEIVAGLAEFDRGEYVELTREQLDHAASTGEWPWPADESRD